MKINLSSDDINLLVYRYLIENGYSHTAFAFSKEAEIHRNPYYNNHADKLPPNALVSFMQKAMIYIYLEYHTDDLTGEQIVCEEPFSFFRKHACFRKLGQQNGLPIKEALQLAAEQNEKAREAGRSGAKGASSAAPKNRSGIADADGNPHVGNSLAQLPPIYVGPPQRRLADRWQVAGYMCLLDYGPKGTAASAHFNPALPGYIAKRVEGAPPALYRVSKVSRIRTCQIVPPAVKLTEAAGGPEGVGTCLRWRYDGHVLCAGYESGAVVIWDTKGRRLCGGRLGSAPITAAAFSGNKRFWNETDDANTVCKLAAGDAAGNIHVFKVEDGIHHVTVYNQGAVVTEIDWRDHEVFTAASADATVRIYNTATNASAIVQGAVQSNPQFMEWGPTGKCLAMIDSTEVLKIYKPDGHGAQGYITSLKAHTKSIIAASWQYGHHSKSVNKLCTIAMDRQLLVWDVAAETVVSSILIDQVPTTITVNASDTFVAVGTYGNMIKVFNLPSLTLSCSFCDQSLPTSITWAADDAHIAYNVYNQQRTPVVPVTTSASFVAD
ncbi:WD G-beta repeat containing protein [Babesia ovata]|uniref:WD G-beta repeat containing protein n=1 Tax=Babesia ovata TaxID=189622 RepID=A0A2H6K828_9APIC|nr:WD G-beta repeat containing protein [Babesia ovata]XP_028865371.1 WD G-beta repeat containing protein [Babesia ovata]GBE59121.1 WD G-beta repeat containing protein [Babesia ovata]GBE59128.1 WD G-beta repeat containing protein [Babesia ovata]